jgi:hypothetical protein
MKTVFIVDGVAVLATEADAVQLFEDCAIIDGGRYLCFNDQSEVLQVEELPAPWVPHAYRRVGDALELDETLPGWVAHLASIESAKAKLADQIDAAVAEVYSRWLRFDAEYVAREAAARAFIADGTPSEWVTGFAVPAGLTEAAAAALIVQQADNLRTALEQLGAQRMRKYEIKAAGTEEVARATTADILVTVNSIAANL